jgi:hypothetical protein
MPHKILYALLSLPDKLVEFQLAHKVEVYAYKKQEDNFVA